MKRTVINVVTNLEDQTSVKKQRWTDTIMGLNFEYCLIREICKFDGDIT